jgi:hypothetical protein
MPAHEQELSAADAGDAEPDPAENPVAAPAADEPACERDRERDGAYHLNFGYAPEYPRHNSNCWPRKAH